VEQAEERCLSTASDSGNESAEDSASRAGQGWQGVHRLAGYSARILSSCFLRIEIGGVLRNWEYAVANGHNITYGIELHDR